MLTHRTKQNTTQDNAHPVNQAHQTTAPTTPMPVHLRMPRYLGNRAMQTPSFAASAGWLADGRGVLQAKLAVSQPDDPYEQEADRVAEQIMHLQQPSINRKVAHDQLQRDEEKQDLGSGPDSEITIDPENALSDVVAMTGPLSQQEEEEEQTGVVQRKEAGTAAATTLSGSVLSRGGSSLPPAVQADMGARFGANFQNVRIHTDNQADNLSRTIGAKAFTYRNHIYFAANQYQPEMADGQRLLAHELTHTIQQGAATQTDGGQAPNVVSQPSSPAIQRRIDTSVLGHSFDLGQLRGAVSGRRSGTPAQIVSSMESNAIGHWGARNPVINMDVVDRWYYYVPLFRTTVGTTRSESTARFGRANLRWFAADDEYKFRFRYQHTTTRGPLQGSVTIANGQSRTDSTTITGGVKLSYEILEVSASASATSSQTQSSSITVQSTNYYEHDYDVTLDYDLKWFNPSDFRASRDFWGPDITQVGGPQRVRGSVPVGSVTLYDDDSNSDNLTP